MKCCTLDLEQLFRHCVGRLIIVWTQTGQMAKKNILLRSKIKKARALVLADRFTEAEVLLEQIVMKERRDADIWLLLGFIKAKQQHYKPAAECFRKAVAIQPDNPQNHYNLGIALRDSGDVEAALDAFLNVVKLQPDFGDAGACLAHAYLALGRLDEAEAAFRSAIRYQAGNAELHSSLGVVLQTKGFVDQAAACHEEAVRLNPDLPVYDNLGSAMTAQGRFDEAIAVYREGLRRQPANARVYSNLLQTLNYLPDSDRDEVFREHRRWGELHGHPVDQIRKHANSSDSERCLRIGYVSPDYRAHSVAYFLEPLLAAHRREVVEVYCYSGVPKPDATTERLRAHADHWRKIHGVPDKGIVEQVLQDRIDILVDLAGHTAQNKLTMFAHKPAPVQVTYLGYPNTTGLPAIDYRLTDVVADPEEEDQYYTEQLVRLPGCFLCYQPLREAPVVEMLPAADKGYITFGSFNNLAKINPEVVALWSDVVKAVPDSRLLVKNSSLTDLSRREWYYQLFHSHGIGADRVELLGHTPTQEEHLALYGKVDIGLDTFPYNGTTTTCEALWMGVPVLTLEHDCHAGRVGKSLLTCTGLDDWMADSPEQFIARGAALTADLAGLADMRQGLRDRLTASSLCDSDAFAYKVEAAYRSMWNRWCDSGEN